MKGFFLKPDTIKNQPLLEQRVILFQFGLVGYDNIILGKRLPLFHLRYVWVLKVRIKHQSWVQLGVPEKMTSSLSWCFLTNYKVKKMCDHAFCLVCCGCLSGDICDRCLWTLGMHRKNKNKSILRDTEASRCQNPPRTLTLVCSIHNAWIKQ